MCIKYQSCTSPEVCSRVQHVSKSYHGDLLVPSFETAGLGPETDHLSPSYDLLNKGPFFTRSRAFRNKMARSSILGPASLGYILACKMYAFKVAGANNGLNVLSYSPLFDDLIDDISHVASLEVNGVTYEKRYNLADESYPQWALSNHL
ncbi:ALP1-like protein [Tanacetum coccineum]